MDYDKGQKAKINSIFNSLHSTSDMIYTADEMVEREKHRGAVVLFDTCMTSPREDLLAFLPRVDDYRSVDIDSIRVLVKYKTMFLDLISKGDFYTSPEVVEELWRFSHKRKPSIETPTFMWGIDITERLP